MSTEAIHTKTDSKPPVGILKKFLTAYLNAGKVICLSTGAFFLAGLALKLFWLGQGSTQEVGYLSGMIGAMIGGAVVALQAIRKIFNFSDAFRK